LIKKEAAFWCGLRSLFSDSSKILVQIVKPFVEAIFVGGGGFLVVVFWIFSGFNEIDGVIQSL
jgi:hypothetical protein